MKKTTPSWVRLIALSLLFSGCLPGRGPDATALPSLTALPTALPAPAPTQTASPIPTRLPLTATLAAPSATLAAPSATPSLTAEPALELPAARAEASIGDPYAPELGNIGYDVQRYDLLLAPDPQSESLQARVSLQAISTLDELERMSLDFAGFDVRSVVVDGQPAVYERQGPKLFIDLPAPVASGQAFSVTVAYQGQPVRQRSSYVPFVPYLGLYFPTDEHLYVIAEPDGARFWFPCNDHPRDKALFRFELLVRPGLVGVANGELLETQTGLQSEFLQGQTVDRYVWEHDYPMATAFATIAVGDYVRVDGESPGGVALRSYVFPAQEAAYRRLQPMIGEMVDWLGDLFGPYPFEAFGYVTVVDMPGALETQTLVVINQNGLNEATLLHEMAHMWFGDWVSLASWGDIWRSEGFATYLTAMWETRSQPAQLDGMVSRYAQMMENSLSWDYPLGDPPPASMFDAASYLQGAVAVHALRQQLGDEAFFGGLRHYFERYGGGSASRQEFQAVLEEESGQDLDAFFAEYVDRGPE